MVQFYWKALYSPISRLYWKAIYFPVKAYDFSVRAYWGMFRLAYPFRKIYYFIHFQYEKRILGLHKRTSIGSGSDL